ncbi:glycosyltransferase family 2 protein [Dyadobacter chenwenxiniae]|uniref:Glycosyltransferase family 2 protein n=1 Tax=Dyadobacter chenwenxiniae TaxID=2906456 RepID=A0A9X1PS12_9BACT|nr:glycosyltransferase [Dyadobacter chenwenxiniae]MCF0065389.1 glycosyltransferase family 2 protein [Dyadobacter chenwenxiniae]UON82199.1 glycosyltransferase family 2 protein [Dyadobacter chenwenxiniae]
MDVSIIIINYRTPQLIINCLDSIYRFTSGISFEVIVVDNDPGNGGGELVRKSYPEIKWIDSPSNEGFGIANNRGMAVAKGKYFLLLNADTLITDNVIYRCFERLNVRTDIIACGALQYYADGSPMPFYQSFNEFRRTFFILPISNAVDKVIKKFYPDPQYADPDQHDWLVGAFIFVRREGFEKTGGFSDDFFMYGEDVEWSGRLGKLGKLCYFKDCKFIHLENNNPFRRTNISWINRFSTQMQISNFLWVRKQYGMFQYLLLIVHYISMIPVVYIWKMALNLRKHGDPFIELRTQHIYVRKTRVILKYFWRTLLLKKGLYKIKPEENIDLLTAVHEQR